VCAVNYLVGVMSVTSFRL